MIIFILLAALLILLYYYGTWNHGYWASRNVKHDKPMPFFGNHLQGFLQKICLTDLMAQAYWAYPNEKYVGHFVANIPVLVLRDPDLIKQVMVTDFLYCYSRGLNPHKDATEPMFKNLFFADGDLWKLLRQRMTPAFTTGKLKAMFPLIVEKAEALEMTAAKAASSGEELNIRDVMARYTTDFIGAVGFGIDADSLNDQESLFRKLGKRIFTVTKTDAFKTMLKRVWPDAFKHLHFMAPAIERDTCLLTKSVLERRNYKPIGRNDFIDLLLELKEKGKIIGESIEKTKPDGTPEIAELELDDTLMAAQVFIFFAAGFETSSSATSFTLHQLAFHPDIQKKCQQEIDAVLNRYNSKLCYEAVKELKYLEMCFKEAMRIHPSLGLLMRRCEKAYKVPGTDLILDKDVGIIIPVQALHMDAKYFDSPEEFRPERFHPDFISNLNKDVYLPFGQGPRACIGERLGLMQSLAGLAAILHNFSVAPSKSSKRHPITDPTCTITQNILGGLPLSLVSRKKDV